MVRIIQSSSPLALAICALLVIQLIGCGEDEDGNVDESVAAEAPPLPPDESMMVDLSAFEQGAEGSPAAAATYRNFTNAVARVGAVSSALVVAVTPPATLFAAARLQQPIEQTDGSWVWTYSLLIDYVTFSARLTGHKKANATEWSMRISTDAPLRPIADFEWFRGSSAASNMWGSWEFFDMLTPNEQNPTVKVDWSVTGVRGEANLTLENVDTRTTSIYAGDILKYSVSDKIASMSYTDASEDEVWDVIWNLDTGEGSITVPGYNDGGKACWNVLKQDVSCN